MHILLIHQAYVAIDEAGGTRHAELAHYLADHGHQVSIIASPVSYLTGRSTGRQKWSSISQSSPNLIVYRCYTYGALHKSFVSRVISFLSFMLSSFLQAMRIRGVDVVWGTSPPIFQGATAWLVARLKRAKFLFEVRDLWPAFAIAVGVLRNRPLIRASEWLERFLYRHADRVVVNSPGFIEHVNTRGAAEVTLIPNSVDVEMFRGSKPSSRIRTTTGAKGAFLVVYAGAHGLSNDLDIVLDAAGLLRREEHIHLLLIGDGKEKARLMERVTRERLSNVSFLPPLPKQEMPGALAAADACLAILKPVELFKTTLPNKVFDYMAAGKPVILAIDGVIRKIVEACHCGIFTEPGNAHALAEGIRSLAKHPVNSNRMGTAGQKYVQEHYNRLMASKQLEKLMVALYENQ